MSTNCRGDCPDAAALLWLTLTERLVLAASPCAAACASCRLTVPACWVYGPAAPSPRKDCPAYRAAQRYRGRLTVETWDAPGLAAVTHGIRGASDSRGVIVPSVHTFAATVTPSGSERDATLAASMEAFAVIARGLPARAREDVWSAAVVLSSA